MKLYVIGIGPGEEPQMTLKAQKALDACEVLVGYQVYIDLLAKRYRDKPCLSTPMTKEVERCRMAFEEARGGKTVGLVCSGDPGIYGMAGLCLELSQEYPDISVEIIPGVTAALSGAAGLGAPLTHDFAVISLSDRLTEWETIEKRLRAAANADFAICIYNPASRARKDYLEKACGILLEHLAPDTVCGCAYRIGREGESFETTTLSELCSLPADMFTTVFIGNSQTRIIGGKMVTPRGYRL